MKSTVTTGLDFPALVKTHHAMVWRYLRLLGCESALAEDLTQDVFLEVFRKPPQQFSDRATAGYLRLVARNRFVDCMRRMNRQTEFDVEQAESVWQEAWRNDQGQTWTESLRECLEQLDGRPRSVLWLRYHDKAPIRKVAEVIASGKTGDAESIDKR